MQINSRTMVMKVMPAVVAKLKERFPNLTAEEAVKLAGEICECFLKTVEEEPIPAPKSLDDGEGMGG